MKRNADLSGLKYGRLKVLRLHERRKKHTYYLCECECGEKKAIRSDRLKNGNTKSCGCLKLEKKSCGDGEKTERKKGSEATYYKHGKSHHPLYTVWRGMKERCNNHKRPFYKHYGGRGIKVCNEWSNDFQPFYDWSISNGYEKGLTLDRKDNNKGYSPENCEWKTHKQQNRNTRRNKLITIGDQTKCVSEWAEESGVNVQTLFHRYKRGTRGEALLDKSDRRRMTKEERNNL